MSLHPLDREIVAETNEWFYTSHPRGRELRGPNGDTPLHPTSSEDAAGRKAWVTEYRRRLAEKKTRSGNNSSESDDPSTGRDPLAPCVGCCPTDFMFAPESMTLEAEETAVLLTADIQSAGMGAGTYTWTTISEKLSLEGALRPGPQVVEGPTVTIRAGREPNSFVELGELVEVTRTQPNCSPLTKQARIFIKKCKLFRLTQPRIIAIATDSYLMSRPHRNTFPDPGLPGGHVLNFGQDFQFSPGRVLPRGCVSVGTTTGDLETLMRKLLTIFASNDTHGKARRLFNNFLAPNRAVSFWSDTDLTAAAEAHPNIISFVHLSLSAPNSPERSAGQTRIHQALQIAGWDINAAVPPTNLGPPAFTRGSTYRGTEDYGNGLGVMIGGIQHAIVVAKEYYYDQCQSQYYIKLEYVFYDVFGLDDEDLQEYGADGWPDSAAAEGITAWWQLQHQHGYAPLITRIAFEREFTVPVP